MIVGPSFSFSMIKKKLESVFIRGIFITTKSLGQYNDEFITEQKTGNVREFQGGIVIYDDLLDISQNQKDPLFTRGPHKGLDTFCSAFF